jgi:predicted nuclease of predicted toxin-antitoxin system
VGRGRTDAEIWEYARRKGFVIATKDGDYRQRAFVAGPPPKVLWLALGNAGTDQIARLLLSKHEEIERFAANREQALLILSE